MRWNKLRAFRSLFGLLLVGTLIISSAVLIQHSTSANQLQKNVEVRPSGRVLAAETGPKNARKLGGNSWSHKNGAEMDNKEEANNNADDQADSNEVDTQSSSNRIHPQSAPKLTEGVTDTETDSSHKTEDIPCVINGQKLKSACLKDAESHEVYVPFFGLIKDYFEIHGHISTTKDGSEFFEWWHNSSRIRLPSATKYDHLGPFGPFGGYNVELRERVRCISGTQGVPMSTQWGPTPYFYPIQIAQFALEHYSKNITDSPPKVVSYGEPENWKASPNEVLQQQELRSRGSPSPNIAFHILTNGKSDSSVSIDLEESSLHIIQFDAVLVKKANISVLIEKTDSSDTFRIDYYQTEEVESCIYLDEEDDTVFMFPLGPETLSESSSVPGAGSWRRITRNILTDLTKAISHLASVQEVQNSKHIKQLRNHKLKIPAESVRLKEIIFGGNLWVRDLTQRSSAHMDHFLDAAEWFLKSQKTDGGWEVPVRRSLAKDLLTLRPGWVSGMGQGHGISVLTRAYAVTQNPDYLAAAIKATKLYSTDASSKNGTGRGGVRNWFLGTVPWYEEYPTTPGSFVLNGFIYSLLGLYDLKATLADKGEEAQVAKLYKTGLASLRKLLPLYDTGSGSYYDLRHATVEGVPPNLARWDYHSLHIYQLTWLFAIERDPMFKEYADRWIGYAFGKRAKHN